MLYSFDVWLHWEIISYKTFFDYTVSLANSFSLVIIMGDFNLPHIDWSSLSACTILSPTSFANLFLMLTYFNWLTTPHIYMVIYLT